MTDRAYPLLDRLGRVPTTNVRILATIIIALGTALRYWLGGDWEPSWEWLSFIVVMAGLDMAQFVGKRATNWSPEEVARADQIRNGSLGASGGA